VASTNANLDGLAERGTFRRDLLARLRSNVVHLAALEHRRADVLDLADAVWPLGEGRRVQPWSVRLTVEAAEALVLHRWPDNLLRSAVLCRGHGRWLATSRSVWRTCPPT
jgi:DNA-binding NtrC family response regulator